MEVNDGSFFTIELNERVYTLKADNKNEARKWVSVLNTLKDGGQNEAPGQGGLGDVEKTQRGGGCIPCCGA